MSEQYIMVSIKPKYVKKILNGEKLIELRKCKPKVNNGDTLIIYATTPVKAIVAYAKISKIANEPLSEFWSEYGEITGISFDEFKDYYQNQSHAVGIEFSNLKVLRNRINLSQLRKTFGKFNPPQTFKYIGNKMLNTFIEASTVELTY